MKKILFFSLFTVCAIHGVGNRNNQWIMPHSFETLPNEILTHIVSYIPLENEVYLFRALEQIRALARTHRNIRYFLTDQHIRKILVKKMIYLYGSLESKKTLISLWGQDTNPWYTEYINLAELFLISIDNYDEQRQEDYDNIADLCSVYCDKVDINIQNKFGNTALMKAAQKGQIDLIRLLLINGANIHIRSKRGYTALMAAAAHGNADIVKLLLENGAHVNVQNKNGWTALMLALFCSQYPAARSRVIADLLAAGADLTTIRDNLGMTALDMMRQQSDCNDMLPLCDQYLPRR